LKCICIFSDVGVEDFDDPDLVTPELIDDVLQRELNRSHASHAESDFSIGRPKKDYSRYSTPDRYGTAERKANTTSDRYGTAEQQAKTTSDRLGNSTAELIALGQHSR
jgi:hypothetical protein